MPKRPALIVPDPPPAVERPRDPDYLSKVVVSPNGFISPSSIVFDAARK